MADAASARPLSALASGGSLSASARPVDKTRRLVYKLRINNF
jgi:hypothetical protein